MSAPLVVMGLACHDAQRDQVATNSTPAEPTPTDTGPAVASPSMLVPNLSVRPVISGLETPIAAAFLGEGEMLLLEKNTGKVQHVVDGAIRHTSLDLAVNNGSERGLLGIALDPSFATNQFVYLFWSCRGTPPPAEDPFFPVETECADEPQLGEDTDDLLAVPTLGNRVDRFVWDGENLTFDRNLIELLSFQNDGAPTPAGQGDEDQPPRGNHDGGVIAFGPDDKLYILFGDAGRRGQLQNLPSGPTATGLGTAVDDDQLGGPEPDDAHFTGVILRLNPDGTTPTDNPFYEVGAQMGGEVGENIQKVFAYGIRNSFGMAFDPQSGNLWDQENGEDAFDELNLIEPGMNSGWIQIIGPVDRVAEFKQIETTSLHHEDVPNLQQFRWGPERIADTPDEALSRLFTLPGSSYSDPEFSWKHVLAPAAIGFADGRALGPQFDGDLFVGVSVPEPMGGPLFHFNLTGNRRMIAVDDPLLEDRVADNVTFHELTESESLVIGRDFGIVTDIETGPNGNLFVISLDQGAVYEVFRTTGPMLTATLTGAAEVPGPGDADGSGEVVITIDTAQNRLCYELTVRDIETATAAHIHAGPEGVAGPVVVTLEAPNCTSSDCITVEADLLQNIQRSPQDYYVNVHNEPFPDGAVRGQLSNAD